MRSLATVARRQFWSSAAGSESLLEQGRKMLSRDAGAALELFQRARLASHSAKDRAGEAEAVLGLANACKAQGKVDAFVSHLKEYVSMAGPEGMSDATKAFVSYELGYSFFSSGDYGSALPYLQAARLAARQADNKGLEAWALAYLGVLYARRGEPEKGIQLMQRGVNVMNAAGDASGERRLLLMTGDMQHELGQLDDAIASYSSATTLARKANDIQNEGKIYRLVGAVLEAKKDFQSAMHSYKVVVQLASQSSDQLGLIAGSLALGNVISQVTPLSAEAVVYWKQALKTCKVRRSHDLFVSHFLSNRR
jgi:tetratricopeptide (TPR) repeat protein